MEDNRNVENPGLYREEYEHDNCGIGACVNIHGEKSRATVENALKIVENLEHRAGKDAEGKTGDGVGILTQIPHKFFARVTKASGHGYRRRERIRCSPALFSTAGDQTCPGKKNV